MKASAVCLILAMTLQATPAWGSSGHRAARRAAEAAQMLAQPTSDGVWTWVSNLEGQVPQDDLAAPAPGASDADEQDDVPTVISLPEDGLPPGAGFGELTLETVKFDPAEFDIPVVMNENVLRWMQYFTGPGRKYYTRWLERSTRVRPLMYRMLAEAGLPRDLVYLSMIESGYSSGATSHAAAAGLWQFIPGTAHLYHMRVDGWVDERRDPERSTEAGIAFLGDLYKRFGDWYLAFSGYNAGPGRVQRAIDATGSTDFWVYVEKNALPSETRNYVPKLLAAAIIGKHPDKYGFSGIAYQDALTYDSAPVEGAADLEVLARCAGITEEEFQALNPALRRWSTPPEGYVVHIPVGAHDAFVAALEAIPRSERIQVVHHQVARGETLSTIASRYGVSTEDLVKANRIRNPNRISIGTELVVPVHGHAEAIAEATQVAPTQKVAAAGGRTATDAPAPTSVHSVRPGDTLSEIAGRYHVTVEQLRRWNGLSSNTIYAGQKLKIGGETPTASAMPKTYTVRAGDTLGKIAARQGCTVAELQSWNGLHGTVIRPGQVLKIKG